MDTEQITDIVKMFLDEILEEMNLGGYRMPPKKRIRQGKQIVFRKKKAGVKPLFMSKAAAKKRAKKSARGRKANMNKIIRKQKKSMKKGRRLGLY